MRMLTARLAKGIGGVLLLLAGMALLACVSLCVASAFVTTWPLLRLSPKDQRLRAGMKLATDLLAFGISLRGGPE